MPRSVRLTAPVLTMVLAATAIPIEVRRPDLTELTFTAYRADVLLNIVGYLPLGFVLPRLNIGGVAATALAVSTLAEASQLFMVHRQPSAIDVVCNVIGATLGVVVIRRFRTTCLRLTLDKRAGSVAALLAAALIFFVWSSSPIPVNKRGWTDAGDLEAEWKFDETNGRVAFDASGHALDGKFNNEPKRVPGIYGNAVSLNGATDYVDAGRVSSFRLVGSMTVSAWINIARSPDDDAAIVSTHNGLGYQLDTTIDRGPRTLGFKLGNACGQLMARYGATPLIAGRWYHVAGVYDAPARSLDVYLNGKLDDGFLLGTVTSTQHSSREPLYIGRRSSDRGFEFAGLIDDVRIYSRALTNAEIDAEMRGTSVAAALPQSGSSVDQNHETTERGHCSGVSDPEDARMPGAAAVMGVFVAVMCLGFWPAVGWLPCLVASLAAGLLLLPTTAPSLPALGRWLIPLASVAGTGSVLASLSDMAPRRLPSS